MNIIEIYKRFPDHNACLAHLERVRWKEKPHCPYCQSTNSTPMKKEHRHHCNTCNTSYSVTVGSIFHKTHLDLQVWFLGISLILNAKKGISARQLARHLDVNKNTAWYLEMRVRRAMVEDRDLLEGIVEIDETYIGGKPRRGGPPRTRGRGTKKIAVVGMAERGGKVRAKVQKKLDAKHLSRLVRENVKFEVSTVITDEWAGYIHLKSFTDHRVVNHKIWYVNGDVHTNTVESFWSLLKRAIIGQYHKISVRYLPAYINEFCYRQNHRKAENLFLITLQKALGV